MLIDAFVGYLDRKSRRGLGRPLLERMAADRQVKIQGRYVCHQAYAPALSAQDERILTAILAEFEQAAFQPPLPKDLQVAKQANAQRIDRLIKIAVATGQLAEIDGKIFLHASNEERLRETVREIVRRGEDASVSGIRQALDTTRKYAVPLMEYLDRIGFTRREGDRRVLCEDEGP